MLNNDVLNFSFEKDNEVKLKSELTNIVKDYSYEKSYLVLSSRNDILLNKCNINDTDLIKILFKNYIYFIARNGNMNIKGLNNTEKRMINEFNLYIENNDFNSAINVGSKCYAIYQLLCLLYINNIDKTDKDKLELIDKDNVMNTCKKISLLDNADLIIKRKENKKIRQLVSSR